MTEDDARAWVFDRFGRTAAERVERFLAMVTAENVEQNLISPGSVKTIWARHAVDSAQLLALASDRWTNWLDIGTGGGFPGMIVASLVPDKAVIMVEPRARRARFLQDSAERLGLTQAIIAGGKVEALACTADVISARAVADPERLLQLAGHCAVADTTWLLPRGRSAAAPIAIRSVMFHVEQSLTDPDSIIYVGRGRPQ